MGASKTNPTTITVSGRGRFMPADLALAEAERAVHFAVAIERLCGWPVHATYVGESVVRYQAESGGDQVYDPRGIFTSARFSDTVIVPLVKARRDWPSNAFERGGLRVGTKCVGEEGVAEAGLIDEPAIERAISLLQSNPVFLGLIPKRPRPYLPANALARYSWNGCAVYAEALSRVSGLPAATMVADYLVAEHGLGGDQFHAVVLHPDGSVEDVWGRQEASVVARRYAMARWHFDEAAHREMIEEALRVRPDAVDDLAQAEALILTHRRALGEY